MSLSNVKTCKRVNILSDVVSKTRPAHVENIPKTKIAFLADTPKFNTSAVAQHLFNYTHAQHVANLNAVYGKQRLIYLISLPLIYLSCHLNSVKFYFKGAISRIARLLSHHSFDAKNSLECQKNTLNQNV